MVVAAALLGACGDDSGVDTSAQPASTTAAAPTSTTTAAPGTAGRLEVKVSESNFSLAAPIP